MSSAVNFKRLILRNRVQDKQTARVGSKPAAAGPERRHRLPLWINVNNQIWGDSIIAEEIDVWASILYEGIRT